MSTVKFTRAKGGEEIHWQKQYVTSVADGAIAQEYGTHRVRHVTRQIGITEADAQHIISECGLQGPFPAFRTRDGSTFNIWINIARVISVSKAVRHPHWKIELEIFRLRRNNPTVVCDQTAFTEETARQIQALVDAQQSSQQELDDDVDDPN